MQSYIIKYETILSSLLKEPVKIESACVGNEYKNYSHEKFTVYNGSDEYIAFFRLVQMPGCCGICISTESYVHSKFRKLGVGTVLNLLRIDLAKELGYGLLMCTDVESNEPQQRILKKNGWVKIETFANPRTKNIVAIHTITL